MRISDWSSDVCSSDLLAGNRGRTDLYLLDLGKAGATPRMIASAPDKNESAPAFSADGKSLYYLSNRSGDDQLWRVSVAGGSAEQVTRAQNGRASCRERVCQDG